jgi:hypothetical protein
MRPTVVGILFLFLSTIGQAQSLIPGCTPNSYREAAAILAQVEQAVARGTAAPNDLLKAQAFVAETKYCAGISSKLDACADLVALTQKIVESEDKRYSSGLATIEAVINSRVKRDEISKACSLYSK